MKKRILKSISNFVILLLNKLLKQKAYSISKANIHQINMQIKTESDANDFKNGH